MSQQPEPSPPAIKTLVSRRSPLATPSAQIALLDRVPLARGDFDAAIVDAQGSALRAGHVHTLQLNLGRLCNMTCRHCHVDAGPDRVAENMDRDTVDACLKLLDRCGADTVDLTGGAPELNPHFRYLVDACVERGKQVLDRCNLSVLLLPKNRALPAWLGQRGVEVVASLPHWRAACTDVQRGAGAWDRSVEALRRLNAVGYGKGDPSRRLTLVHNPVGASLAGDQVALEREWHEGLASTTGITFDRLIAIHNMPVSRFLDWLHGSGKLEPYLRQLSDAFNPATVDGLMCRHTLSVGWDGRLFDCDFNQMLDMPADVVSASVHTVDVSSLAGRAIRTGRHCFGCTAGAGSSCSGATS